MKVDQDGKAQRAGASRGTNYATSGVLSHMLPAAHSFIQRKPCALDTCTSALQITSVTLLECVVLAFGTRATGTELAPLLVNVLDHMKEVEAAVHQHMQMAMISGDNCV